MTIDAVFTHFPILTTDRLILREVRPTDAEALFAIKSDPQVTAAYGQEPHQTLDETHTLLQQIQDLYNRRRAMLWGITLKGEDIVIGSCTFWNFSPDLRCAETGYELHRAYWRQGITAEAVSAVLTLGFTELELHRIEAVVDASNAPSRNLLLKLGFTFEGSLRERAFFRDHYEDEQYFGLLRDEWTGSPTNR